MARHKKKFSVRQLSERLRIETELSTIPKQHPMVTRITSVGGFVDYYLSMRDLYNTQIEAYEHLEGIHIAITGKRRYAEFASFRVVVSRCLVGG